MTTLRYPQTSLVADSFSRSAGSYDGAARLQRQVGDALFGVAKPAGDCLDLGCGTGFYAEEMVQQASVSRCLGVDIAAGMLDFCRQHRPNNIEWLQADARYLPLAESRFDTIFSSLMLQWLGPDVAVFSELQRILKPGGRLAFSTLLDGTLAELKTAWAEVDTDQHVNDFDSAEAWYKAALSAGFEVLLWQPKTVVLPYAEASDLLRELKALGAHNVNPKRPRGMTGKQKFARFGQAYERFRAAGTLPASYQVLYGVLQRRG